MLDILRNWNGSFDEESIGATLYTRWYIQFIRSLYMKYQFEEDDRMAFSDNYHFTDAFQKIITSILDEKETSHFQIICEESYQTYPQGTEKNPCAYNIAMALLESKDFLSAKVS